MEETGCYLKFQRQSIIEENTKVTDNICWFNGKVWANFSV